MSEGLLLVAAAADGKVTVLVNNGAVGGEHKEKIRACDASRPKSAKVRYGQRPPLADLRQYRRQPSATAAN